MALQAVSDQKPSASLGPLLLARKGTAKPAMRAQLDEKSRCNSDDMGKIDDQLAASQADLGWNDMGEDVVIQEEPEVHRQQTALVHRIADANLSAFQSAENQNYSTPSRKAAPAVPQGRRTAFTLRLDEARHLKLKLATTVKGESAQQLVTRALDLLLSEMPEIEMLAAQVTRDGKKA